MSDFTIWVAGNVVLPLLPLALAYVALRVAGQARTAVALFGDGGVLFYATSLAASMLLDIWKDRIAGTPRISVELATVTLLVATLFTMLSSGLFAVMTLARIGPPGSAHHHYNLTMLSNASWQSATLVAILCSAFRWFTGLY